MSKQLYRFKMVLALILLVPLLCGSVLAQDYEDYSDEDQPQSFVMPPVEAFIGRWSKSGGSELGASQSFILGLCDLLGVPQPAAPRPALDNNDYAFEAQITFTKKADGRSSTGRIDLYKKGHFIWESKQGSERASRAEKEASGGWRQGTAVRETKGWDSAMIKAKEQAEEYANGIPITEGRPPFIIVSDVGYSVDLFADFHNSGVYAPFPTARDNRIYLEDFRQPEIRERLRLVWTDPMSLDPSREREKVTRDIAVKLGDLAKSLEDSGHDSKSVADNLMGFILIMFAEDCNLLPAGSFARLMAELENQPQAFVSQVNELWGAMSKGGQSTAIDAPVARFAGPFDGLTALPLTGEQIAMLHEAAVANWAAVEPSVFGTLLRRTIDPQEKHKLGAHYTPPSYVERLVYPTMIAPLRTEWNQVVHSALNHVGNGDHDSAISEIVSFHRQLSETVVLDPSCGSGNFLSVSLQLLKTLEGEVIQALRDLGQTDLDISRNGYTVSPRQFKGIEISPHAAAISELVLWISYLQKHFQLYGNVAPMEPILRDYGNIECRDAVLAWDTSSDESDDPRYLNARPADPWPPATYIVGNPPFIGGHLMKKTLGASYVEALRKAYPEVPQTSDYVYFWWHRAAQLVRDGKVISFGLITTNSLSQPFGRKVLEYHMKAEPPLSLVFVVPNHPWVDASADSIDKAQVRIALTVGVKGEKLGTLSQVILEKPSPDNDGFMQVFYDNTYGKINSDLTIGADLSTAKALRSNLGLSNPGVEPNGPGFVVTQQKAAELGLGRIPGLEKHIRPYRNGRDITGKSRDMMVIDLLGLSIKEVEKRYPDVYQWLVMETKPVREKNNRKSRRENWWIFGEAISSFRPSLEGLERYIVTSKTSRRRFFTFLDKDIIADSKLIIIASDDAYILGVLSSHVHNEWAVATGGRQGVGNDSVYVKTISFDAFPFPDATEEQKKHIRSIAETIDAHRKERQGKYPQLTLTDMYAVLDDLYYGVHLTGKKPAINEQGDIPRLLELHTELDRAVADAYGWPVDLPTEELLEKLLQLNLERTREEKNGQIRWLRPEYQDN